MSISKGLSVLTLRSQSAMFRTGLTTAFSTAAIGLGMALYLNYSLTSSPGWHNDENGAYYIVRSTHERAVGLKMINNSSYLFDENGILQTGWQEYGGNTYYFDKYGTMLKGVVKIDGEEYYLSDESGIFKTGLQDFNGEEYYFNDHGFPDMGFDNEGSYYYDEEGKQVLGWAKINDIQYYFFESGEKKGQKASGFTDIDGKTYYFATDGHMVTGLINIDGADYDFQQSGVMFKGWTKDESGKYFMYADETTGIFAKGFVKIDNEYYYFDQDCHMLKGWQNIGGESYHFDDQGVMTRGWFEDNGEKYYFHENGICAKGFVKKDLEYYYLDDNKKLVYGWFTDDDGNRCYADTDGKVHQGFLNLNGSIYFFDQDTHAAASGLTHTLPYTDAQREKIKQFRRDYKLMQQAQSGSDLSQDDQSRLNQLYGTYLKDGTYESKVLGAYNAIGESIFYQHYFGTDNIIKVGWQTISGYKFYFDPVTGEKVTGWRDIGGTRYFFGDFGVCAIGKFNIDGMEYEFTAPVITESTSIVQTPEGIRFSENGGWAKNGFRTENGQTYYFNSQGYAVSGPQTINGMSFYFNNKGIMYVGVSKINNNYYYFSQTTGMVLDSWVSTDPDTTYYFGSDGTAETGWSEIDGIEYYFGNDGKLARGWTKINGYNYYFDNGAQLRGPFSSGGIIYVIGEIGYAKEGWAEWNGLRYYTAANGEAYTNTTLVIDGVTYTFDSLGVATES
ncbi:MAG: cell wall-binding protein [Ruminococcus sp.]|nr:cell wall-binding protein [Ruminococcus sp.]